VIHARFFLDRNGSFVGLEVNGHAGLAEAGEDILCAAVSVLTENLGGSLELLLGLKGRTTKGNGYYKIELKEGDLDRDVALLFSSTHLGLAVLREQYPDRIELETRQME